TGPDLEGDSALPGLGHQLLGIEAMADLVAKPQPIKPGGSEHDGIEPPLAALAEPGIDVPAQRLDGEVGLESQQLRPSTRRGGSDPHSGAEAIGAAESVTGVVSWQV